MGIHEMNDLKETANLDEVEHGSHGSGPRDEKDNSHPYGGASTTAGLERYINLSSVVNFGVVILGSWESFALTFQFALLNGGPSSMFYGAILVTFGVCSVGFSLAELAAIDPTVGAQYRWSANLAPSHPRFWGLIQGWITIAAWCFACAGPPSILANLVSSLAMFNYPEYVVKRWHTSLIMIATMIFPLLFNLYFRKVLDTFEITGGILHIVLFIVFIVVLVVFGPRSDPSFVFDTLTSDLSGWNNEGVSWGLGLLTVSFSVAGFDSILHMSEEVKKVRTRVPRSIIAACTVNCAMLLVFVLVILFYMGPTEELLMYPLPLIYVLYGATGSKAGTNAMIALTAVVLFLAFFNAIASVSRLIWVFARDKGLPFHKFFGHVHPTLKLPLNALFLICGVVTLLALIYMASATAFNALVSLQALALHVSYFLPILFMFLRRIRGDPPTYGPFKLGKLGVPVNLFALCYLFYICLWMPFPQILPVTKDTFNYSGPIFGAVIIAALADWFISGKTRFQMPVTRYE
ncbi:amino acid transporter [Amniculicola lignicola CBS 123094]|uniref:Amino acid transporter n=1 Tax=Amniculicola lignicola CBS 123094 TaxID=1392246 RepID=A0A6A5W8S0_9PLEO|nr:amino acid transporter [Amniculicola lignicola CBS 123094]